MKATQVGKNMTKFAIPESYKGGECKQCGKTIPDYHAVHAGSYIFCNSFCRNKYMFGDTE